MDMTRREALAHVCMLVAGLPVLGVASFIGVRYLVPPRRQRDHRIVVGRTQELPQSGALRLEGLLPHPIVIRRERGEILAFSTVCTHLGCEVTWRESERAFVCPCHSGRFDAMGLPVAGPVQRPLGRYVVKEENGLLVLEAGFLRAPSEEE